jgi:bifunctional non-homologous end joining protein LigD
MKTTPKRGHVSRGNARRSSGRTEQTLVTRLERLEAAGGDGEMTFARGKAIHVSSLDKVFFPDAGITKGDVMRYYAVVAPALLPVLKDRPLILKRYPNGITGHSFFQQGADNHPAGVRVAEVATEEGERARRFIGGDLITLLYTVQLGTIAVHPWQSHLPDIEYADYSTIDLDPGQGVPFGRVVELAERIRNELEELALTAALKTSGSRGLHIVLPMPTRTSYVRSAAIAEHIARRIATKFPSLATLERSIRERPKGTIYVDAKQNAKGKSVASAYSVRERAGAPVSAPLQWSELKSTLRIDDFTIASMPQRLNAVGDLWGEAMKRRNSARAIDRALASQ